MENYIDLLRVILRALVSLITLFLVTKLIGKKQVSELSLFDYVIGISIGNFAAEMTINLDSHYLHGTVAVIVFGIMAYVISYLTMKSIKLRRFFSGVPTIIIDKGIIQEKALKNVKYDINDLLEQTRQAGYFNISDIYYAIMEANGSISFLPKSDATNVTRKDLKIKKEEDIIYKNVILDGKFMYNNMTPKEEKLVKDQLKANKKSEKDVLLGILDKESLTTFDKNNDYKESGLE